MPFANMRQWRREVESRGVDLTSVTKTLADTTVGKIKDRIPPNAADRSGMTHPFPGYAAPGVLKSLVRHSPVQKQGDAYRSTVGVEPHPTHPNIPLVHEFGMTIKAKRAPYLVFQIDGKWIRTKQVYIRPKFFFRAGWNAAASILPAILQRELSRLWK